MNTTEEKKIEITSTKDLKKEKSPERPAVKKTTKKLRKLSINTSYCRGEIKLIRYLIAKNGWKEVTGTNGDILWWGQSYFEDLSLATDILINRLPGMRFMAHKKTTGQYLNIYRSYFPEQFDFFPRTFLLPEETSALQAEIDKKERKLYIVKPTDGSQGDGIYLCRTMKEITSSKYVNSRGYVVQEYVDKPLIIDGKKFDLRVYVLISSVKPLIAFVNKEGLARFCTEDYEPPTNENIRDVYKHLTNYSLNKLSEKYVLTEETQEINDGSKRTFCSLWKSVEKAGYDKDVIWSNIKELIRKLLIGFTPFIHFEYNTAFGPKNSGKCFQVIGVDILIDENLKPWLLEINNNPSLNIEHELEVAKSGPISPVDLMVKSMVVEDAINLVRKKPEKQLELEEFKSYEKVFNGNEAEIEGMEVIGKILEIYGKLSGFKFKETLGATKFVKLAGVPIVANAGIDRQSLDILFTKIVGQNGTRQMDFLDFIHALEYIAGKATGTMSSETKFKLVSCFVDCVHSSLK